MRINSFNRCVAMTLLLCCTVVAQAAEQRAFSTPTEAVKALVNATESGDQQQMLAIFGDEAKDLVYSGDEVQDKTSRESFVKAYKTKHALVPGAGGSMILQVGPNNWPMPIPLLKDGALWRFDTTSGKQELIYRRIGHNELGAIAASRGYIAAQRDYAATGHDGLPAGLFAQKLVSDAGKQNGLYWPTAVGDPSSPMGPLLAEAGGEGYSTTGLGSKAQPYHGYLYRTLKAQGGAAEGGARNYLVSGKLSGGVALVAYPAGYRVNGVMTFLINIDGVIYQKDLGPDTEELAAGMTEFNPDSGWKKVAN